MGGESIWYPKPKTPELLELKKTETPTCYTLPSPNYLNFYPNLQRPSSEKKTDHPKRQNSDNHEGKVKDFL